MFIPYSSCRIGHTDLVHVSASVFVVVMILTVFRLLTFRFGFGCLEVISTRHDFPGTKEPCQATSATSQRVLRILALLYMVNSMTKKPKDHVFGVYANSEITHYRQIEEG